jgi:hypothetical protein
MGRMFITLVGSMPNERSLIVERIKAGMRRARMEGQKLGRAPSNIERYHSQYWEQLVKERAVPDTEYERFPRGRVSYDRKSGKFELLADPCILRRASLSRFSCG